MPFYPGFFLLSLFAVTPVCADQVEVVKASVTSAGPHRYNVSVTLRHHDSGWEHYADKWEVLGEDGHVYGTRILLHPHVEEQPFTRQLDNIEIPAKVRAVTIRAHDSVHGHGPQVLSIPLP